jgi:hypothetical protein
MTTLYHCGACGWDWDTPALADEPLGEVWLWTLRVCPDCGEAVYATVIPQPPQELRGDR